MTIRLFVASLLLFLLLDAAWFAVSTVYPPLNTSVKRVVVGGGLAWIALALGQAYFVRSVTDGFLFGLVVYAVFNGTEHAIRNDWGASVMLYDTAWGCFTNTLIAALLHG
jgi:uncharacterized membrane protein